MKFFKSAVFAHYMVGTITEQQAHKDVMDAHALGLDAFALNIGQPGAPYVEDALRYMFDKAEDIGFSLFISMDVTASGCWGLNATDFGSLIQRYQGSSAYARGPNGFPFLSTFSDGGWTKEQWNGFLTDVMKNQSYFVPDFDGTKGYYENNAAWWDYWGGVAAGFFSWESAWPLRNGKGGKTPGDISPDQTVIDGTNSRGKSYMIGLSPLQYKNAYGTNVYRQGDLNLPIRMENILKMKPRPNYVQINTWNDGPESHYVGNLFEGQNKDFWPAKYSGADWPHTGWQSLIASFTKAFNNGKTTAAEMAPTGGDMATGSMWYHPILTTADCKAKDAGTPPAPGPAVNKCPDNTPASHYVVKPEGFGNATDTINWAVVLSPGAASGYKVRTLSDGKLLNTKDITKGLNHFSVPGVKPGKQVIELVDDKNKVVMTAGAKARPIASDCPNGIWNMNYVVDGLVKS